MYDGTEIQKRNILDIPSKRRNPIIADVFQRLDFMERRGSGFKKIYETLNDKNNVKFYSDKNDFKVTLYNENYTKENEKVTGDFTEKLSEKLSENQQKMLKIIAENSGITQNELSLKLNVSRTSIIKNVKILKEKGIIERVGSDRKGYWKILVEYK